MNAISEGSQKKFSKSLVMDLFKNTALYVVVQFKTITIDRGRILQIFDTSLFFMLFLKEMDFTNFTYKYKVPVIKLPKVYLFDS